jgi:hypothetical protein
MLAQGASSALHLSEITELVWPQFIELNGCVIRDRPQVRDSFDEWWQRHGDEPWRFPGRSFEVFYATEPDEYGPTVSFYQPATGSQ